MEQYQFVSMTAILILIYSLIAFVFYKIGRYHEKQTVIHLYKKITNLTQDKSRIYQILNRLRRAYVMELINNDRVIDSLDGMYNQGKIDIIKRLGESMLDEHNPVKFVRLPNPKSNEGELNDSNNSIRNTGVRGINISLN